MKISSEGLNLIKTYEGFSPKAYICPAGVVTIGYGTTVVNGKRVKLDATITEKEASECLKKDVATFEAAILDAVTVSLSQPMFDALVCFVYNIGQSAFLKSTLLKLVNAGELYQAAGQFKRWNKASGKELPGLTRRRAAEEKLFLSGIPLLKRKEDVQVPVVSVEAQAVTDAIETADMGDESESQPPPNKHKFQKKFRR